jgi:hypothetical protein
MTLAILDRDVAERLTDRDWPEIAGMQEEFRSTLTRESRAHRNWRRGGNIVVTAGGGARDWMLPIANALDELLSLPANWDSHGARALSLAYVPAVLQLLLEVMPDDAPLPAIVPTSGGGIQLEWHTRGIDLEVEFVTPTRVWGLYEDLRSGQVWEAELTFDRTLLVKAIAELAQRAA